MLSDTLDMNGGAAITDNLAGYSWRTPDTRIISWCLNVVSGSELKKNFYLLLSVLDINL